MFNKRRKRGIGNDDFTETHHPIILSMKKEEALTMD